MSTLKTFDVTLEMGRTDTVRLRSDSLLDVKSIYENFSEAKITQIKEVVYFNPSPVVSNTNFYREMKVLIGNGTRNLHFVVKFVKPLLDKEKIISLIKTYVRIDDKKVSDVFSIVRR